MAEVVRSIPFPQDEVDIKWQLLKGDTAQQAMAIAVQKRAVDQHVQRLKQAGKSPSAAYSQAAALGLVAGVPDAMVVHLWRDEAAVILVRERVPQAVHKVLTPEAGRSPMEQAEAVARAVEQMEGFDQMLGAREEDRRLPLVLTGLTPNDGAFEQELRQTLQREILPLSPPVVFPEGFPIAEFAPNIGLALLASGGSKVGGKTSEHGTASVNLLSRRHVPAPIPFGIIGVFLALAVLAGGAFYLTPAVIEKTDDALAATTQLEEKEQDDRLHQSRLRKARTVQNEGRDIHQLTLELKSRLDTLTDEMATLGDWFERVDTITEKTRPPGVQVNGLTPSGNEFTLAAEAPTLQDAIKYAANIRDSGLFTDVDLLHVQSTGAPLTGAPATEPLPGVVVTGEEERKVGVKFVITAVAKSDTEEGDEASEDEASE